MHVERLVLRLRLANCPTPREKHRHLDRICTRLRAHFNVSLAVLGGDDAPDRAVLAAVAVSRDRRSARETLAHLADALSAHPEASLDAPPDWL